MAVQIEKRSSPAGSKAAGSPVARKPVDPGWAWAPYQPDARRPWNLSLAGHLFRRAAFGADWDQLRQALADGPQPTVDKLLRPETDVAAFNREYDDYEAAAASGTNSTDALRAWWLRRMTQTPHPLLEKMTLFWHSHFAVSNARVGNARLMQRHVQRLRSHALGRFETLLAAVFHDPAVLVGLGADANRKAVPNESFARALLENFTLGPGRATEKDVREMARALTGTFVLSGRIRNIPREHDDAVKRILGQQGDFTGDDVVRIVLEHPATPRALVRKLYRRLISETEPPEAALVDPLAESFAKDYDVLRLVETMLRSNLFFSPTAYRRRIKSPVEFALGIVKSMESVVPTTRLAQDLAAMGQNLYAPPTVKGWAGGRRWIDRVTLARRHRLAVALLQGKKPYGDKLDPPAVARKHGHATPERAGRFLLELFLQSDLEADVSENLLKPLCAPGVASTGGGLPAAIRRFAVAVVTLPEFHLA